MLKKILPILAIFTFVLLLYYPALFTYFAQDDFFHFKVSQTDGSLLGLLNLFNFHPFTERGIAFYRPISRELPFNLLYSMFGLNALPFRIIEFLIHFINIYLTFVLVQKLFSSRKIAFFVSFFFGITAANVSTLYYLAGGIQTLLATTFTLSTLLLFRQYIVTKKLKFRVCSFLTFLLGISSHEQTVIIPILLIGLILISNQTKKIRKYLPDLVPYFLTIAIFIPLEVYQIGFSSSEQQYQAVFNIKRTLNSLSWYAAWALGLPETLIDFVLPGLKLNPTLLRYWSNYYIFIFPSFATALVIIIITSLYLLIKKRKILTNKAFIFAIIWFPLGLLPVLLLPLHKSTHYLTISLPAFWIIVGYILLSFYQEVKTKLTTVLIILFFLSLVTLSTTSALLGSTNYWAASRGKLAQQIIRVVQNAYPALPKGAIVYFKNDPDYPYLTTEWGGSSKQVSTILNGSDALQLLYKDPSLKVYYEDINTPDPTQKNIYSQVAKLF